MSRTRKDRPYWVRANDKKEKRVEHHNHELLGRYYRYYGDNRVRQHSEECTIDLPRTKNYGDNHYTCTWELDYGYNYLYGGMSVEERHQTYYNPLRTLERDTLRKAVKEYNATGDIEYDIFFQDRYQHQMLNGGYWD